MFPNDCLSCDNENLGEPAPCLRSCDHRAAMIDMRRYLFRNVACEYRKGFADFSKMPDLPGWV